jgi:hypothetical protein
MRWGPAGVDGIACSVLTAELALLPRTLVGEGACRTYGLLWENEAESVGGGWEKRNGS